MGRILALGIRFFNCLFVKYSLFGIALRVSQAVTRLTVNHLLHIMVAWMIAGPSKAKLFMARDPFNDEMLRIHLSDRDEGSE